MIFLLFTGTSIVIINILSAGEHSNIVQCSYVCTSHAGTAGALVVMTVVLVKKERKLSKNI